jgi:GTP cyclohydrolase I
MKRSKMIETAVVPSRYARWCERGEPRGTPLLDWDLIMMPQLKDVLKMLDVLAPFSAAEEWDNPGLQVGFISDEIKRVLISLDPTIRALQMAGERKAQLLLTHHPLIFKGLTSINPEIYPGDVITAAIKSRISVIAVHTNLDIAKGGINDILARMIGLKETEALLKKENAADRLEGLGRIGNLPETMSLAAVARIVMEAVGSTGLMVMGPPDREIKRVAILGGAGGSELSQASEKGADLYITGDVRHHEALMAQSSGLALIDAGHFNMERAAMHAFADDLGNRFRDLSWDVIIEIFEDEKAPMRYMVRQA